MIDTPSADHVNQLLLQFAAVNGLPAVVLGELGTCTWEHPAGIRLNLELSEDGEHLHWYTRLCETPASEKEEFYGRLLQMNLLGLRTRGGQIGMEPDMRHVVFSCHEATLSLDSVRFTNVTENFLHTTLTLKENLVDDVLEDGTPLSEIDEAGPETSKWQMRV